MDSNKKHTDKSKNVDAQHHFSDKNYSQVINKGTNLLKLNKLQGLKSTGLKKPTE